MKCIMLGNLSVKEIEERLGFPFSDELKKLINEDNRQWSVDKVKKWEKDWHCFDVPFIIMMKNKEMAQKVYDLLGKEDYKTTVNIAWHE